LRASRDDDKTTAGSYIAHEGGQPEVTRMNMGVWIAIGAGIGVALGAAMGNTGVGIALGAGIGLAIGAALGAVKRRDAGPPNEPPPT
jgi:hypothetical protein